MTKHGIHTGWSVRLNKPFTPSLLRGQLPSIEINPMATVGASASQVKSRKPHPQGAFLGRIWLACLVLLGTLVWLVPAVGAYQDPKVYHYRETRNLVAMVNNAAQLVAQKGEAAFQEFAQRGSRWFSGDRYIFIYDTNGVCVFHPTIPSHVGRSLLNTTDILGKPMVKWFVQIVQRTQRPYGWVYYHQPPPNSLFPLWKSTYVVGVRSPSGKLYAVCSGLYNMRIERQFITDLVDRAANLIERQGTQAFALLKDEAGPYIFDGTYVFVLKPNGQMVLDPAFPNGPERNALDFTDVKGRPFIRQILKKIEGQETAYGVYMWHKPGSNSPSKKLMFLRRVEVQRQTYYVGSDFFLSSPIWLRY